MKASQGEERGRKHIGAEIDPGLEQFPILRSLADKENAAEQDRQARASQAWNRDAVSSGRPRIARK